MALIDDIRALDDEEWGALWPLLLAEAHRRQVLATAQEEAERLASAYLAARDGGQDTARQTVGLVHPVWVQPTGAHDAYPAGYQVAHGGRVWRSAAAANVWEPGGDGVPSGLWEDVTDDPEPVEPGHDHTDDGGGSGGGTPSPGAGGDGEPEPYTPPTPTAHPWEAGVPYYEGDLVTYAGATYTVVQEHTSQSTWTPDVVPALYEPVT